MYDESIKGNDLSAFETVHGLTNTDRRSRREKKKRGKSPRKRKQDQVELSIFNKMKPNDLRMNYSTQVEVEDSPREGSDNHKHIDLVVR